MSNTLVCIDVYTVSAGDTLYTIAEKYDLPVSLLMKVNCITNPYNLQILQSRKSSPTWWRQATHCT